MASRCTLLCDHREHAVTAHAVEWVGIRHRTEQITTGDYAIIDDTGRILVIIERKTLEDFGASFKDARHENRQKLTALSAATGCRIVYIIESPDWPSPSDTYARIPYRAIESGIFHLMLRDNICVLRTQHSLDTAQMLARFVQSCDTLIAHSHLPEVPPPPAVGAHDAAAGTDHLATSMQLLTARAIKNDVDIARAMWARFRGITTVTADEYLSLMSLRDLFLGVVDVQALRLSNGKPPPARAFTSLRTISTDTEAKILSSVPGISVTTARAVIAAHRLRTLLTFEAGAISIIKVPSRSGTRNLGMRNAENILRCFAYKHAPAQD